MNLRLSTLGPCLRRGDVWLAAELLFNLYAFASLNCASSPVRYPTAAPNLSL